MTAAISTLLYALVFVALLFVFAIRPQRKRQRELQELFAKLKPGDEVLTMAGIYGTITEIEDDKTVLIEIAENTEIRIARGAIASLVTPPATGMADAVSSGAVQ